MREFKARQDLLPFLCGVLEKRNIKYKIIETGNDNVFIQTDISGMEFHRCIEDALCIEQQGDGTIPVLPYRVIANSSIEKPEVYHILAKDEDRVKRHLWPTGNMAYSIGRQY